ncbi:MAG: 2-amino-4-hydroxy-6-hydroxymethyldihydropteridine diphosphokinase [Desulfobulbaceae bacterium]|uniref:2-amino-4-hydroxy-6-hydroxymethyldihydropteridine pyrophosphokinase n=1 Tax=Candidatus Desulfatifera sulfidica TaxID=2841691 RepID=A0A8J6N929_9BACT|nr:2-amino-4-hydroxy-6-hydroxymethyldihydropteridine diphosphokinase [Candidatus Desulfatifera sulfidica]
MCIGLGSNLGDGRAIIEAAWQRLGERGLNLLVLSSPYGTTPVDMSSSHDFINAAGLAETSLSPHELLTQLLEVETEFGRNRTGKETGYQDRSLDLDILFYGSTVIASGDLVIPHPQMARRLFVLAPLAEIAPDWLHPLTGLSAADMQRQLVGRILGGQEAQQSCAKQHWHN